MYTKEFEEALRIAKIKHECQELLAKFSKKDALSIIADIYISIDHGLNG